MEGSRVVPMRKTCVHMCVYLTTTVMRYIRTR